MTLIWSPESIHDLISLRTHIAEHDPAAANRDGTAIPGRVSL
jgi:plasmid stabilization system protein ParE